MTTHLYNLLVGPSYIAAFVGALFLFYALRINRGASVNFIRAGVLLIAQCLLLLLLAPNEEEIVRQRLKEILDRRDVRITLNGKQLDMQATREFVNDLKAMHDRGNGRSSTGDEKLLRIFSKLDTLNVTMEQLSYDSTEYLVYVNKPTYPVNATCRVRTEFFMKR